LIVAMLTATATVVTLPGTAMAEPDNTSTSTSTSSKALGVIGDGAAFGVDLFVLRPLGICRLAIGLAVLLPISSLLNFMVLPLGQDTNVFSEDWERLVVEPKEYAFDRALGEDLVGG
jgi:hypothetical protein